MSDARHELGIGLRCWRLESTKCETILQENYIFGSRSDEPGLRFGITIAIVSALSFGVVTIFAKMSYAGGANAITFAIVRALVLSTIALLPVVLLNRDWRVSRAGVAPVLLVTVGQAGVSVCLLSAVQFIPVSHALLIMYIYPALVLVVETVLLREALKTSHVLACLVAFVGLSLVLGPSAESLDWRGVAFAAGASVSIGLLMLAMRSARRHVKEVAVILWGNLGSLPVIIALWPLLGGVALPTTQTAWIALVAGSLFFCAGFCLYALSLRHIRAGRAAMIYNFEPLAALVAAAAILGERLTLVQLSGAALVFMAILVGARK